MKRAGATKQTARDRAAKARSARVAKAARTADAPPAADRSDDEAKGIKEDAPARADALASSDPVFAIAAALTAFGIAFWLYETGAPPRFFGVAIAAGVAILFVHVYSRSKRR